MVTTLELIGFLYPEGWVPFTDSQGQEVPVHLDHADGTLFAGGKEIAYGELAERDAGRYFQRTPDESGPLTDLDAVLAGAWVPDGREFPAADQGPLPSRE